MLTHMQCLRRIQRECGLSSSLMACVRLLDGTYVMTTAEYSQWRDELCRQEDVDSLFDTLRRHLAKRFPAAHWYTVVVFLGLYIFKIDQKATNQSVLLICSW